MAELMPWSVTAVNLPDHADNLIHTDAGARAAGFESALVAGTTVYAYMTHPPVAAWGLDWVSGGGGELRLKRPVFDRDPVDCVISIDDGGPMVTASVASDARASLVAWKQATAPPVRAGEVLPALVVELGDDHLDYGMRCGDDLTLYAEHGVAHPVTWPNLANAVFKEHLVTGPWIHVRSKIFHEGVARLGSTVRVESNVVERFESRAGRRALVDMRLFADGDPIATIEHEAIIELA